MKHKQPQQTVQLAEPFIRSARDLLARIENNPNSAAQIVHMDVWERWLLEHGSLLVACGFNAWEAASLECIVRESPVVGRIPQQWLFEGGPRGDDPRLLEPFLSDNTRKVRIGRFKDKVLKLGRQLGLTFKVERATDCSKTIYTAQISIVTMPRISARDRR